MRQRSTLVTALVVALTLTVTAPALAKKPDRGGGEDARAVPTSMAAIGDSITRAFNACGWFFDCTSRAWSTGSGNGVTSHFDRLRATDATMSSRTNRASTGAKVADLPGQASAAVSDGAGYVTILIGANDACTSSESTMTSVADFTAAFQTAMSTLDPDGSGRLVFVSSIPDVKRLWEVGKHSSSARTAWASYGICQSLLANPTSTDPADEARRDRVQARVAEFNAAMAAICDTYANCDHDDGAVFAYPFELSHLSGWDYFHPNTAGQQILSDVTWSAGFDWAAPAKGGGKGGGKPKR